MPEVDPGSLVDQCALIGLVTREQMNEARAEADDAGPDAVLRILLRKGRVTSWQLDRLKKGNPSGFFYGDFKVLFHLAEGTFARVYRGEHTSSAQAVAIKVLRQRFAQIPDAVSRFHKEAEAGMRLRHENIVSIIDEGRHENQHFMIMEYVEGMNLRDFLRIRHRMKGEQALPLMLGLARGLQYSFAQGVTHRDIKGTNILVSNNGVAKLVDFGLATIEGDDKQSGMKSQRTVDYSALERTCRSPKGDPRSDIYFLGCVFYQMITGQLPMEESESKDMLKKMLVRSFGAIKPIGEHTYAPDEDLSAIIAKMMKLDLAMRYQTMDEVVTALENYKKQREGDDEEAPKETAADEFESIFELPPEPEAEPKAPEPRHEPAAPVPTTSVLCVESQDEIQDALRKSVTRLGHRPILVHRADIAAGRFAESPSDAVIFDTDGQEEPIEALLEMRDNAEENERPFRALVLLGPRQEELREQIPVADDVIVLVKPVKIKEVRNAIQRLLPED